LTNSARRFDSATAIINFFTAAKQCGLLVAKGFVDRFKTTQLTTRVLTYGKNPAQSLEDLL